MLIPELGKKRKGLIMEKEKRQSEAEGTKEEQRVAEISRGWQRVAKWRRKHQRTGEESKGL
jgi:hypothetical protein